MAPLLDPARYAAWFETPLGRRVWADEERVLRELLGPVAGRTVLDAGCGASVVAADRDPGMLREARARSPSATGQPHLVRADLEHLPFADDGFDLAVAVTTLCLVRDPRAVVAEVARVVRPQGRVLVGELGRWSLWALRRRVRGGRWLAARFWTRHGLVRLLEAAALVPTEVRGAVYYSGSAWLGRVLAPLSRWLERRTSIGAAFLAVAAVKRAPVA
jgi:SAM-dependent methyltransferase